MPYFSPFPRTTSLIGRDAKGIIDIFRHVDIQVFNTMGDTLLDYEIRNGETPEMVADRLYGNPHDYWLLILANRLADPTFDWPLYGESFEKYLKFVYGDMVLHIGNDAIDDTRFFLNSGTSIRRGFNCFVASGTVDLFGNYEFNPTNAAVILDFNPTTSMASIRLPIGSAFSPIAGSRIGIIDSEGKTTILKTQMVHVDTGNALHHFADADGNQMNPLATPAGIPCGQSDGLGGTVSFNDTILYNYLNNNNPYGVTNREFEIDKNEKKRSIKYIPSEDAPRVKELFERLIGGRI